MNVCVAVKKKKKESLAVFVFLYTWLEKLFLCQVRNQTFLFFDAFVVFTVTNLLSGHRQVDVLCMAHEKRADFFFLTYLKGAIV